MKLELEREGVHLEICSVNDWIYFPSPTCVEEGGNRWTQEEEGGECGTKEMGEEQMESGESEEESQQGWEKSFPLDLELKWRSACSMGQPAFWLHPFFSPWHLAIRSFGPSQQLSASQGTCRARSWTFPRGHLLQKGTCTVFKSCNGNGRGELCASTGTKMGWDVVILPGILAKPEIGVYNFEEVYYTQFFRIQ